MPRRKSERASIRDVAARAGVSVATVSRILAGTYKPPKATHDKVLRAVRELDYVVNANARGLARPAGMIAMIVNDITAEILVTMVDGIEEEAVAAGKLCIVASSRRDPGQEISLINLMRQRGAEAVILVGGMAESAEHLQRLDAAAGALCRSGSRLLMCGRTWQGSDDSVVSVQCDNENGAFAATSHLLAAGHRRIAHLAGPLDYGVAEQRLAGYRRALEAYGIEPDPKLVVHGDLTRRSGYQSTARLLESERFTAVFAANDLSAAGAVAALRAAGRQVPEDVSMVGFDDIQLAQDLYPKLTTVHLPQRQLGRACARLALHPEQDPALDERTVTIGTHIVVRDSVRPARA